MARVLIVDDEELMREAVRFALEQDGHECHEAENGQMGLLMFEEKRPDVVITDLIMPHKEGIETIRVLRKRHPEARILALSGRGGITLNANLERARQVGANAALLKPCNSDEIREAVRALMSESTSQSPAPPTH